MNILHRILGSLEARYYKPRLRILRSLYVNFRLLPPKEAIKMPIFVYGRLHCWMLNGSVEFQNTEIRRGMIKFGTLDPFNLPDGSGFLSLSSPLSRIIFTGPANIDINSKIHVFGDGIIRFGKYVRIRSGVKLICNSGHINIGDYTGIPFETVVMNSSFHTIYNTETLIAKPHIMPIEIGAKCWIGNRSTIVGGTKLKDGTIVAAGSFVNKDFTVLKEEGQLIGGRPAKLLKANVARVFTPKQEIEIISYFKNNPNATSYHMQQQEWDMSGLENEFK